MLNKIVLYITKGCEGCKIAQRIIGEALVSEQLTKHKAHNIIFETHYDSFVDISVFKHYDITDFPTTIFLSKNGNKEKVHEKLVGTTTKQDIINKCMNYFM